MKLIITLLITAALLGAAFVSHAQVQKYILTTGTNGYVTIRYTVPSGDSTPQDYTRGLLMTQFYKTSKGDTQMTILQTNGTASYTLTPYTADSNYQNGDASNGNFPNADSLYRWTRRHLQKYVGN